MPEFTLGLDLGQAVDYSAAAVVQGNGDPGQAVYEVRHLTRWVLGTEYPVIIRDVEAVLKAPVLAQKTALVLDRTGCGRPVFDSFKEANLAPIGITIHGGDQVVRDGGDHYRVPKRDIASILAVLLHQDRLRIGRRLAFAPVLVEEMKAFKVKITATAHDTYESDWRTGAHDDLILAVGCACWYAEKGQAPRWEFF